MKCPQCQWDVSNVASLCPNCGFEFTDDSPEAFEPTRGAIRDTDGWAVTAFISSLLFFIPLTFLLVIPCAVIGFLRLKDEPERQGRGLIVAALLLGLLSFLGQSTVGALSVAVYRARERASTSSFNSGIASMGQAMREMETMFILQDLTALHGAMTYYYTDFAAYPEPTESNRLPEEAWDEIKGIIMSEPTLAQAGALEFYTQRRNLRYNSDGETWYIFLHDRDNANLDVDVAQFEGDPDVYPGLDRLYDPTNGLGSSGDLWITGPDLWGISLRPPPWMMPPAGTVYSATVDNETW